MLCSLSECREDIDPFKETDSGLRTVSFNLNGEPYSQKLPYRMDAYYDVYENRYDFTMYVFAYSKNNVDENGDPLETRIGITIEDVGALETDRRYEFGNYTSYPDEIPAYYAVYGYDYLCSSGWVEFRNITILDTGDAIISGNFEFEGTCSETGEEFHVTGGTFDMVASYMTHDWPLE